MLVLCAAGLQASRLTVLDMVDSLLELAEEDEAEGAAPSQAGPISPTSATCAAAGPCSTSAGGVWESSEGLVGPPVMDLVLGPWLDELLVALKAVVSAAWGAQGSGDAKPTPQVRPWRYALFADLPKGLTRALTL